MTNQEYFQKLQFEYELALRNYLIADKRIFEEGDGWVDKFFLQDLIKASEELDFSKKAYDEFISIVRTRKIDPNAQFKQDGY
jgi:hypothetical protein